MTSLNNDIMIMRYRPSASFVRTFLEQTIINSGLQICHKFTKDFNKIQMVMESQDFNEKFRPKFCFF